MESDEIIGSRRCSKCGRLIRVLPDARCSCEPIEIDKSKLIPLSKKQLNQLKKELKFLNKKQFKTK